MVRLNLIFGSNDEFEKAVDHFENFSDFYPDEKNYRYRQLSFDCNNQEDADMNERAIDKEIMNSFERYHFEIEDLNESKKSKVKTLIERIVKRVIAKKLNEAKDNSITSPTAKAYFMYLKSLDKSRLLSIAKSYHRIDSMDKGTPKMDLVYDILASEHGNKWFEKTIRLPEYAKKFLKESIKTKRRLNESKYDYFKTVKDYASNQLADFFRVNVNSLQRFNFDGNDDIAQLSKALNSTSDEGTRLYYNAAIESAKRELDLDESIKPKRRLKEATDPDGNEYFHINDLEDYIYENIEKIKDNMSDYGWKVKDIPKMRNYYDFSTLLGLDSRLLKTVDLEEYTSYAYDIIKNEISNGYERY